MYYINTLSKNFVPLFRSIMRTEECKLWNSESLNGEEVQKYKKIKNNY